MKLYKCNGHKQIGKYLFKVSCKGENKVSKMRTLLIGGLEQKKLEI
jgi:hypothetical protein